MKPRNKFEKQIVALAEELPPISEKQIKWAYKNCLNHLARRTKKGVVSCLECGQSWQALKGKAKYCICPHCQTKLTFEDTQKRVFKQDDYFCIITASKGFQVLRFFHVERYAKVGQKARYFHSEVVQRWMATNGKYAILAKLRPVSYYCTSWCYHSSLEIRNDKPLYNIHTVNIAPRPKFIHEIKRTGFNKDFYELSPFDLLQALLDDSRTETLLKSKEVDLLRFFVQNRRNMDNYWASIRICLRNHYKVQDAGLWCDYVDLLRFFGKDLHNSKYVCPENLEREHDKYMNKRLDWLRKQHENKKREKALKDAEEFDKIKAKFFGLQFSDGLIQVKVLESIEQFIEEGETMHHCLFSNEYHLKEDSLIFSASLKEEKLETIEVSLSKLKVVQSRGVCNENTDYHDRIISLVNSNIHLIEQRLTA